MIGHDENQEEVSFKVTDRRKFNPDGSVKDGVVIEPAKAEEPKAAAVSPDAKAVAEPPREPAPDQAADEADSYADDEEDFPVRTTRRALSIFYRRWQRTPPQPRGNAASGDRQTFGRSRNGQILDRRARDADRKDEGQSSSKRGTIAGRHFGRPADAVRFDGSRDRRKAQGTSCTEVFRRRYIGKEIRNAGRDAASRGTPASCRQLREDTVAGWKPAFHF